MVFYGIEDKAVLNPYTSIAYFKMGIFAPGLLVHLSYLSINSLGGQSTNTEQLVTFVRLIFPFHPKKYFEKFQGNYANIDSENVKLVELEKILMPKIVAVHVHHETFFPL